MERRAIGRDGERVKMEYLVIFVGLIVRWFVRLDRNAIKGPGDPTFVALLVLHYLPIPHEHSSVSLLNPLLRRSPYLRVLPVALSIHFFTLGTL